MTRANAEFEDEEGRSIRVATMTGDETFTSASPRMQSLDPGGSARTITMPAVSSCVGAVFFIANTADGAEVISIKDADANTIVTPTQNEAAIVWCDGSGWHGAVGAAS